MLTNNIECMEWSFCEQEQCLWEASPNVICSPEIADYVLKPIYYLSSLPWILLPWPLLFCRHTAETASWTKVEPKGKGPCPRRRQCCCMVGDRIMLFGGTRWALMSTLALKTTFKKWFHGEQWLCWYDPTCNILAESGINPNDSSWSLSTWQEHSGSRWGTWPYNSHVIDPTSNLHPDFFPNIPFLQKNIF